ncbi:MAG: hypothetical protein A3F17_03160 [Gammaproteobacteria bacterium RIFCSPHIGHO2_12_FULL_41_15]|nr:MAG: hypothetical protein A3F17_03160 [Gammaproteobacteria bacterium RIFCSPHIGHO2_12_FULL_41_15]
MKLISLLSALTLSLTLTSQAHLPVSINQQTLPSLAPILKKITPAVVNVYVEKDIPVFWALDKEGTPHQITPPINPLTGKKPTTLAEGTGAIIDANKGYVITNAHVVDHSKNILVTLKDGRRARAHLVGQDNGFDIAVLQISLKQLKALTFADSGNLQVGDFVTAIGSPFGLSQSVTTGIVSALHRSKIEGTQNFIQTDASINPGNSGGPLINLEGQVVGINTAIFTTNNANIGIGFAIPGNTAQQVAEQLIHFGHIQRGMLGVMGQTLTAELADAMRIKGEGVLVTEVKPDTPAAEADIKAEDIITRVNGNVIRDATELHNVFSLSRPKTTAHLSLIRDNKVLTVAVKVGDARYMKIHERIPMLSGLRLQNFNELEESGDALEGALIMSVDDHSKAALAGLTPGDIILQANHHAVHSVKELIQIAQHVSSQLLLEVMRGEGKVFLVVS